MKEGLRGWKAEQSGRAALTELDRKPGARHAGPERGVTANLFVEDSPGWLLFPIVRNSVPFSYQHCLDLNGRIYGHPLRPY